jgi:hypothetical protein
MATPPQFRCCADGETPLIPARISLTQLLEGNMTNDLLIAFGFSWMLVAALIGLYLGVRHEAHGLGLARDAESGNLIEYHRRFDAYKWRSSIHAHAMLFSLSSIVVGIVMPRTGLGDAGQQWLTYALVASTVVWTAAALGRIRPAMGLADILFAASLASVAVSIVANSQPL